MNFKKLNTTFLVSVLFFIGASTKKMAAKFGFTVGDIVAEGRITDNEVNNMQEWLHSQGFQNIPDEQVVLFLLSCDRKVDCTKTTIREYYRSRKEVAEIFQDRTLESDGIKNMMEIAKFNIIPNRTKDGSAVVFFKLTDGNHRKFDTAASMKLVNMVLDTMLYENPPTGVIMMFDTEKTSFLQMAKIRLGLVMTYLKYLQEGLPVKLRYIHVLNISFIVDKILMMIKPFMNKNVQEMLITHPSSANMDEFFENAVEKDCMPLDYGGTQPSVEELDKITIEKVRRMVPFFIEEEDLIKSTPNHCSSYKSNAVLYITMIFILLLVL